MNTCYHILDEVLSALVNYAFIFYRNPDYQEYKVSTSPIVPFIPALYKRMNKWLKMLFCCEFPFYSNKIKVDEEKGSENNFIENKKSSDETTPIKS